MRVPRPIVLWIGGAGLAILAAILVLRKPQQDMVYGNVRPQPPPRVVEVGTRHWKVGAWARDEYLANLARVNQDLRLLPNPGKEPDTIVDLEIAYVAPQSPMAMAGFRKGDRILQIGGSPVSNLNRAVNLIHEIKRSNRLLIQIERDGKHIDFLVEFE